MSDNVRMDLPSPATRYIKYTIIRGNQIPDRHERVKLTYPTMTGCGGVSVESRSITTIKRIEKQQKPQSCSKEMSRVDPAVTNETAKPSSHQASGATLYA